MHNQFKAIQQSKRKQKSVNPILG